MRRVPLSGQCARIGDRTRAGDDLNNTKQWITGHPACIASCSPDDWQKPVSGRYRATDSKTYATLFPLDHGGRCSLCKQQIGRGEAALGVSPRQRKNPTGKWMFFCESCIPKTVFVVDERPPRPPAWTWNDPKFWTDADHAALERQLERELGPVMTGAIEPVGPLPPEPPDTRPLTEIWPVRNGMTTVT
jgi:hypothetical protein